MAIIKKRSVGESMEKSEPCPAGGNVIWCSQYGEKEGGFFRKLKTELFCDPAIPLLGIYQKEMKTLTQKDLFPSVQIDVDRKSGILVYYMFITTLFTIAKIGNNLSVPHWMNE